MKIMITGSNGQVGSELNVRARTMGFDVIAVDCDQLDITQRDAVNDFISRYSPDLVINAAAYTAVDKAEEEVAIAFAVNRDGPLYLANACAERDIPLFHISTDYVFDGEKEAPYTESDQPNPQGVYGQSKLEGELAVASALVQQITLRVAWVFGATGANFVRTMLRLGGERAELGVVADQYGGPTYAGDIAETLLMLAEKIDRGDALQWGLYHYIGSPATSWHGFAEEIFKQAVSHGMLEKSPNVNRITTEEYPTPATRPKNSVLDSQRINEIFGVEQPDWRQGLDRVLRAQVSGFK
ncbi:MAG: dTDP-4-dehydrorhamnose reductase [Candidatus Sedimenticola sp. (ex Thyasira tokunagai)]